MDQLQYSMELAAFDEKIALAEVEEAKANERTKELKYQKTRFQLDWLRMVAKAQEEQKKQPTQPSQG